MKKLSILFLSLVAFGTTVTSCSKDDDAVGKSGFEGKWVGAYTGSDDNGTWSGNIGNDGTVTGSVTSKKSNQTFELVGTVSASGQLSASFVNSSGNGEFKGEMNTNSASGTWKNKTTNFDGTWVAEKD